MFVVIGLKEIITIIMIPVILFLIILFNLCKWIYIKLFCVNCYKCKKYYLHDVASAGDYCYYKCTETGNIDMHSFNDVYNYKRCKKFE